MKPLLPACLGLLAIGSLAAAPPKSPNLTRYQKLWTDSPFTSDPVVQSGPPPENPLNDYALGGISKLKEGYYAILIDKKSPDKKVVIKPGDDNEFKIEHVNWAERGWRETTVMVRHGMNTATLAFDNKLLEAKSKAAQNRQQQGQQQAQQPNLPPGVKPPQNPRGKGPRPPRPRVVVPPKQ